MTKKEYMKPAIQVVELQQHMQIICESTYGMKNRLVEEEVNEGW